MLKVVSICLIVFLSFFMLATVSYAGIEGEASGSYIIDRGIIGVAYSVLIGVCKTVEAVVFGRYGIAGIKDYFQFNKIFKDKQPQY